MIVAEVSHHNQGLATATAATCTSMNTFDVLVVTKKVAVQEQNSPGNGPETVPETVLRQHERSCIPRRVPHCAHC
eukprot:9442-Heterococcus_DN1.PRE.1